MIDKVLGLCEACQHEAIEKSKGAVCKKTLLPSKTFSNLHVDIVDNL